MTVSPNQSARADRTRGLLRQTLGACRGGFRVVTLCSFGINVLMLTAPLYMLQVFDRVISARSTDTLLYLTLIALAALLTLGALEVVRGRTMVKLGTWLDARLSEPVLAGRLAGAAQGNREPSLPGLR
ncbi:MAG: hypothetical protein IH804_03865, partial [Planctomycetes bacterium]|nr:hypothetical protein [Planctomycetota bacterium]